MKGETLASSTSLIGSVLLGRYRIVRELAKGGMGVVYLARSEGAVGFVKPVVVKLVLPEHASDKRFLGMFAREAQILAHLRHPSIVDVLEFGEQDGAYVMVLEYVRGYHLGQWGKYLRLKGRTVPAEIVLQLMIDVLDALHHAHSMAHPDGTLMHIVHRDVSPSNILLDEDGRARLLDFGVARMRGGSSDYQTQVKGFVGKLMYSAPEIFAEGDSTPKSDCYSCAVVLHETLTGRNAFRGENQAKTLNKVLNHMPESVERARNDVPPGLDAVLSRAYAKAPDDRYASARDFAAALRTLQREPESEVRARLAALLKADFGREMAELLGLESLADRDDAWRRLSHRPPASDQIALEPESRPSVLPRGSAARSPRNDGRSVAPTVGPATSPSNSNRDAYLQSPVTSKARSLRPTAPSGAILVPPLPPPARVPAFTQSASTAVPHLVWAGVAVLALAVLAFVAWRFNPAPTPVPSAQIRVVGETPMPAPVPEIEPLKPLDPAPQAANPERERPSHAPIRAARTPDAQELTRAFRKQQPKIEGCFKTHATAVQGLPTLQLEFALNAEGKLTSVRVAPQALAVTELGKCIQRVAGETRFPAQGKAVSFAIPLSASRSGG
jgi:eukaryotic-like serine/threonine-protein kinase